jgi:hypothetical protein
MVILDYNITEPIEMWAHLEKARAPFPSPYPISSQYMIYDPNGIFLCHAGGGGEEALAEPAPPPPPNQPQRGGGGVWAHLPSIMANNYTRR